MHTIRSKRILDRAAKPLGFYAKDDIHLDRCMRLVRLGLLRHDPNELRRFRRTDEPDAPGFRKRQP